MRPFRTVSPVGLLVLAMLATTTCGICPADAVAEEEAATWEDMHLTTKDGLRLKCRYYFGKRDKQTVPIIMLHAWGGQGSDMFSLAESLSDPESHGHAVIVPDLRGHGGSTAMVAPNGAAIEVNPEMMRPLDLAAIVRFDMQAIKRFLRDKHNSGQLNIETLTLIAAEESAIFASEWAAMDWQIRQLPAYKLGQYVKAIVMISPQTTFKGLNIQRALSHPEVRSQLSVLIVYGESDSRARGEAQRVHTMLKRFHLDKFKNDDDRRENQDLFLQGLDTSLQGDKLLTAPGLNVAEGIASFIDLRLVQRADQFPWEPRENPFTPD